MDTQLLFENIRKYISLSEDDERVITSACKSKHLKKKQFLLQEGEVQGSAAFVVDGCLRSYSIDNDGFEHILQFATPGWWIGDMQSSLNESPATLNIEAIYDTDLILIDRRNLEELYRSIPRLERFFRILAERSLAANQQRLIDSLSLSAAQRYDNFCKRYPSLISCLPQKYVASYIGITPEFLSKMLKEKIKRK